MNKKREILARKLHEWYLEAVTSGISGNQHNPNAVKSFDDLTEEQKAIDRYIADKALNELEKLELTEEELTFITQDKKIAKTIIKAQQEKRRNGKRFKKT